MNSGATRGAPVLTGIKMLTLTSLGTAGPRSTDLEPASITGHADRKKIHVLLTVPHLVPTASPYREMMAIVKYLPRDEFALTVCALRPAGLEEAAARFAAFGADTVVTRFRPTTLTPRGIAAAVADQRLFWRLGRIDLQHSLDFTSSPFEGLCARAMGRPYVYTQRNLNEDGHERMLKMKIRLSRSVLAISRVTERLVISLARPGTVVDTIPLGFDFDDVAPPPVPRPVGEPPLILCVGHLQRRKRVEDAINAVAIVRRTVPGARLLILGRTYDHAYKAELLALGEQLGMGDAVQFLGVREDVIALMQNASALLHCSESEAFGWSLLEAMAAGLPVVAYESGGPSELIEHGTTGFLAKVGDYEACSGYLASLLGDAALSQRISHAASTKARADYTAIAFAERHAVLYRRLVGRPRRQDAGTTNAFTTQTP
jgi:glycosyltransferase involved in cell wall biosynthesis